MTNAFVYTNMLHWKQTLTNKARRNTYHFLFFFFYLLCSALLTFFLYTPPPFPISFHPRGFFGAVPSRFHFVGWMVRPSTFRSVRHAIESFFSQESYLKRITAPPHSQLVVYTTLFDCFILYELAFYFLSCLPFSTPAFSVKTTIH